MVEVVHKAEQENKGNLLVAAGASITTAGIFDRDRALIASKLGNSLSQPVDFTILGHMVPLQAREVGLLTRRGHKEAVIGWL